MIDVLDALGPALWRAAWQAAALAVVVALLLRGLGERLSPRWRFLLWGVVLVRLLVVMTPPSPWSAFNLVRTRPAATAESLPSEGVPFSGRETLDPQRVSGPAPVELAGEPPVPAKTTVAPPGDLPAARAVVSAPAPAVPRSWSLAGVDAAFGWRVVTGFWLAGCIVVLGKLVAGLLALRRRLSACRPLTDASVLEVLETFRQTLGLRHAPELLVTPDAISPCLAGTWRPRIVLPELLATEGSNARLRHVLAHELAHLVRGDLWTNWLLLAVRVMHWFNPVAWWTVRELQAEREAACDERALALLVVSCQAFPAPDRTEYAATIVDLAAAFRPSTLAPGLVGLFSSTCRLKTRIERLLRSRPTGTLWTPLAAGLLLAMAFVGLTDAQPPRKAQPPRSAPTATQETPRPELTPSPEPAPSPASRRRASPSGCTRPKAVSLRRSRLPKCSRTPPAGTSSRASCCRVRKPISTA